MYTWNRETEKRCRYPETDPNRRRPASDPTSGHRLSYRDRAILAVTSLATIAVGCAILGNPFQGKTCGELDPEPAEVPLTVGFDGAIVRDYPNADPRAGGAYKGKLSPGTIIEKYKVEWGKNPNGYRGEDLWYRIQTPDGQCGYSYKDNFIPTTPASVRQP